MMLSTAARRSTSVFGCNGLAISMHSKLFAPAVCSILRTFHASVETHRTVDVAIIGSGFAGLAAAIEASNCLLHNKPNGKIIIVEKMAKPGGNSIMNAGQIAAVGSKQQKQANINDSVELMMNDLLKAGVDLNHPGLIRRMIEESNDLVEWTKDNLGIKYRDRLTQMGGHSVPRTISTLNACGSDIIDPMLQKVQQAENVDMMLNTAFEKFVVGSDGRRVEGIQIRNKAKVHHVETIHCENGVILAAGGFGADVKFRSIQNPSFDEKVMSTNQPGATAEVIKEALKIGAMSVQLSRIQLGPWTSPDEGGFGKAPFFCLGSGFPYGIIVDPESSQRFVNELGNRYERSMAILKMGHPVVCLTDSDGAKHSLKNVADLAPTVRSFDSIKKLAKYYKMDPSVLTRTVADYNQGVDTQSDAFGKPFQDDLQGILDPPFYATRLWPKVHHCMGGLHISENAQVMHIDGYPIGGLFAAGEVAGGVHGGDRLGSCATLDCLSFGRIAGHSAAESKSKAPENAAVATIKVPENAAVTTIKMTNVGGCTKMSNLSQ